jgi:hypothetical protein
MDASPPARGIGAAELERAGNAQDPPSGTGVRWKHFLAGAIAARLKMDSHQ